MEIKYEKPIREIYLSDGSFDGYETEEVIFDIDYEDVVKVIFDEYYSKYDYETFKMVLNEFDVDVSDFIDNDEIVKALYEKHLQNSY